MVVGSSPVSFSHTLDFACVSSKEFLDIQMTIECGLALNHMRDIIRTYSQMHRTGKYSQHSSMICFVWLNDLVFIFELNACGLDFSYSHLYFKFSVCF